VLLLKLSLRGEKTAAAPKRPPTIFAVIDRPEYDSHSGLFCCRVGCLFDVPRAIRYHPFTNG